MSESKIDTRLWSSKARNLSPYVPGEQPQHDNLCKLNTNENPFPPSPKVGEAIAKVLEQQADELRLYPAPESNDLRAALAQSYNLDINQVFVGNGSDEVLALVFASFFLKERPLLSPDIGYSFYPVYAQTFGVELVQIPLEEDFSIDPDAYRQPCSGIIIANPNAPTGLLLSLADIRKLASEHSNAVIVIDEAYIDFAQIDESNADLPVSAVSLINECDNVIVTQTFSKSRSLAGLRVGMAFGNASLIEALTRMKNSFNSYPLDKLAQAGATASVLDTEYFEHTRQQVIDLRTSLTAELTTLGYKVLPSHANFVFARPKDGNASAVASALREQGIIVRHFDKPRIAEYLRITIGTAEQNERLIDALKALQVDASVVAE
ncbi:MULTISPECIES: histidinol-phosphate transaminase [Psychrobacter]|jgi:histidinol-phosphate aminotransferase|uniref:histidinol-phosphate transaminase n=1 Tax=Psychrobacter TaxID=497 RepID=UPI00086F246C|nr:MULTISPECIES: histidinol-phosphate transaminase [Psychrobacter]MBA6244219.1 histidinol-phosphate transaminase [Psychrobacter sp. Urea-trap-18]MBA6286647.1 histidinol-phosphate transaminase [Psychrobacter sp. Urea-trap-16]MBA6317644.1 histidinol-phosphate transaminase [Psychrobacter sp. Urea-trap-20]MBA6334248.1 histidinol-phosphate transaminase [Psychrobacter sp. Urea-trap-19]OEH67520.1 MAG: histidinol-phosphate transaminase [Psychrobacter sp. B29-1]|tara:strand:+ start:73633 stop:74766 length:1134 start_codon:yes stop_codon:yes gene_type:complete